MKRVYVVGLLCRNCGNPIADDGRSTTGFVHTATERSRCDGQRIRDAGFPGLDQMAVIA